MSDLADACADAAEWLPRAAALTTEPDTGATMRGGKPGSRPPWNQSAANAMFDMLATIADIHAMFGLIVTGHTPPRAPAAVTGATLAAIERLSHAVPDRYVRRAAHDLVRGAENVQMLTAVDEIERPQMMPGVLCPYCEMAMVMTLPRAGLVYCKRGLVCADSNGFPPRGQVMVGRLGPCVEWQDGLVT